jgi:asparagine synthase (glutamine-hydrolysing)
MCGITTLVNINGDPVDKSLLKLMNDSISHRGPDDDGFYSFQNVGLGHRRLSIIDLSKDGHQPMECLGKYVIIFNGEVYNYIEIKQELITLGYTFKTKTDTEVIVSAFHEWGSNCLQKFNGMWAFVILNLESNELFISRDRFGVKPLYYGSNGTYFAFGSEIKQILKIVKPKLNLNILADYLVSGLIEHKNDSFFKDIKSLPAGHFMVYNIKNAFYKIDRYYEIRKNEEIEKLDEIDSMNLYRETFYNAVQLRLRSDVKVGTCLSGGLDSSWIAALASRFYKNETNNDFTAITAQSIQKSNDETHFAEMVAKSSPIDWIVTSPSPEDFLGKMDQVIYCQEEPFGTPSVFMQHFVMKMSKAANCTVLLDGQGGDETLLGYERYFPTFLKSLPLEKALVEFGSLQKNTKLNYSDLLFYLFYFSNSGLRKKNLEMRYSFLNKEVLNSVSWDQIEKMSNSTSSVFDLQKMEMESTCLPHLLKYEDRNSMWYGIEARLPFLDYRLVEIGLNLKPNYKIKNGWSKNISRVATRNLLPKEIRWRKHKFGFEAPDKIWLANTAFFKKEIMGSEIINKITSAKNLESQLNDKAKLWKLFNIAKWERAYNVEM